MSLTYFCIFMEMPPKFATAYLAGGYLIVLPHMSYACVNFNQGGISDGSATNVICTCELQLLAGISDGSATNVICTCELQLLGGIWEGLCLKI